MTAWGRALSRVVHVSETLWGPDTGAPSRRCWSGCRPPELTRGPCLALGRGRRCGQNQGLRGFAGRGSGREHGFPPWRDTARFLVAPTPWPHAHFVLKALGSERPALACVASGPGRSGGGPAVECSALPDDTFVTEYSVFNLYRIVRIFY